MHTNLPWQEQVQVPNNWSSFHFHRTESFWDVTSARRLIQLFYNALWILLTSRWSAWLADNEHAYTSMPVSETHLAPLTQALQFQPAIPTVGRFKMKHSVPYSTWHSKVPSSPCSTAGRLLICPPQVLVARWMPPAVICCCANKWLYSSHLPNRAVLTLLLEYVSHSKMYTQ